MERVRIGLIVWYAYIQILACAYIGRDPVSVTERYIQK